MFRRIATLVSAAAAVAAVICLLVLFTSNAQISFAEVMDQVARTQSMTCKQTMTIPGKPAETVQMAVLANGLSRLDLPNGYYTVMDMKTGKALCVSPKEKKATVMIGLSVPQGINLYQMFRNIVDEKSVRLPDETISGKRVNVFSVERPESVRNLAGLASYPPMKIWVDPQTKLPIRMELFGSVDDGQAVVHDFVFDKPLDESLFSLDPPEGYQITTQGLATLLPSPDQQELLAPEIMPGIGLGPVKFGMSEKEVVKILGKPDVEEKLSLAYPSRGYSFIFNSRRGLILISCLSQQTQAFKTRDFAGKTSDGIGIGSTRDDLEKAFGKPSSVENYGPKAAHACNIYYNKLGLEFTLYSDKVVRLLMSPTKSKK